MKIFKKIIKFISSPKNNYPNVYILLYHILKGIQKIFVSLGIYQNAFHGKDMFNWSLYSLHYKGELVEARKTSSTDIRPGDYKMKNGQLEKINQSIKPLFPPHRFLYETIMILNPSSVFEMGCGSGMHLNNLQSLMPNTKLSGIDLLESQVKMLKKSFPDLKADIRIADATIPLPDGLSQSADLAYTQAVLMHIHTDNLHLVALANLFKIAKKQIILMESERTHQYIKDIKKMQAEKKIDWENIYFYNRLEPETNQPMSIICSKEKLSFREIEAPKALLFDSNL